MEELINVLQEFGFEILLTVILPFVAQALIALTKKWLNDIKQNQPDLSWFLENAVEIAVRAAEQTHAKELFEEKKQYAFNVAQAYLNEHGWDEVDVLVLEAAIEAEVLKQKAG